MSGMLPPVALRWLQAENCVRRLLTALLVLMAAGMPAAELTKDELIAILAKPASAEVVPEMRIYPVGNSLHFRLKINNADGTSIFAELTAKQWYVDGRYVVASLETPNGQVWQLVRTYDPEQRLYYGWDIPPNGTVMHQSGMYDAERKIMAWSSDETVAGKRFALHSIQSFANRSLITWKAQNYVDGVFKLEVQGECQSTPADIQP